MWQVRTSLELSVCTEIDISLVCPTIIRVVAHSHHVYDEIPLLPVDDGSNSAFHVRRRDKGHGSMERGHSV